MKVAIISFGMADVTLPLAKYMASQIQVDVYFVFSQTYKCQSVIDFSDKEVVNGLLNEQTSAELLGEPLIRFMENKAKVQIFMLKNLKLRDPGNISLIRHLAKHLKEQQYQLIHFNGNSLFQVLISCFTRKIPKVNTIHDFKPHIGERKSMVMKLHLPERLNRYLVKSRRHIIVHALEIEKSIFRQVPSALNIHTIYYGPLEIYTRFQSGKRLEQSPYILFFGRIEEYKGVSYLIEAFNQLQHTFPHYKLVIAGSGAPEFIEELKMKASSHVVFFDRYISNNQLADLIQHSHLIVCPYIEATQSAVIQTAYAFDKPVVSTIAGGLPEVVEHGNTGLLIPVKDVDALIGAISQLLEDNNMRLMMSGHIRNHLNQKLAWPHVAQQTIEVYKQALAAKHEI